MGKKAKCKTPKKSVEIPMMDLPEYIFYEPHENQQEYDDIIDEIMQIFISNITDAVKLEIEGFKVMILPKIMSLDSYKFYDNLDMTKKYCKIYNFASKSPYYPHTTNLVFDILRSFNHIFIVEFYCYVKSLHIDIPDNAFYNYHYFLYTQKLMNIGIDDRNENKYVSKKIIYDICRKIYAGC